jgi:hypothetical protein
MARLTATPSSDRPLYKRFTVIAGAIMLFTTYLESTGSIPYGTPEAINNFFQEVVAPGLGALGIYRHIPTT